jgi:hypothetical protein
MATAVLIITLLTLAASLASWLFSQWLARRVRISAAALAVGGGGAVLLISSVAFVIIAASTGWQQLIPVQDFSPLIEPAPLPTRSAQAPTVERQPDPVADLVPEAEQYAQRVEVSDPSWLPQVEPPAELEPTLDSYVEPAVIERYRFGEPKDGMLEAAERNLEASQYAAAIDVARRYLTDYPRDAEMSSLLARSLFAAEHPASASIIPAVVVAEWPATDCIASKRSDESARWMLDNGCGRVVAVLFASCELSETACFTNALVSQGWSYEPTGILMTAANDKPVPLRLGDEGPLVAPIFTIRDAGNARRRIRYLACEVTAPGVLQVLRESDSELTPRRLTAELRADACYAQVLDWSRSGQRLGASPDSLLRNGID